MFQVNPTEQPEEIIVNASPGPERSNSNNSKKKSVQLVSQPNMCHVPFLYTIVAYCHGNL